jgi:hypothetical protein
LSVNCLVDGPTRGRDRRSDELTVIYVTCNENHALEESLTHLPPSQPVTILDVGSSEDASRFAEGRSTRVLRCKWRPVVEEVLRDNWSALPAGWLLRLDPDEHIDRSSLPALASLALASPHPWVDIDWLVSTCTAASR